MLNALGVCVCLTGAMCKHIQRLYAYPSRKTPHLGGSSPKNWILEGLGGSLGGLNGVLGASLGTSWGAFGFRSDFWVHLGRSCSRFWEPSGGFLGACCYPKAITSKHLSKTWKWAKPLYVSHFLGVGGYVGRHFGFILGTFCFQKRDPIYIYIYIYIIRIWHAFWS